MSVYWLLLFCSIFLILEIVFLKLEYISPAFLYTASFVLCSMCTAYMSNYWPEIEYLQIETVYLIVISIAIFLLIEFIFAIMARSLRYKNVTMSSVCKNVHISRLNVSKSVIVFAIILGLLCVIWTFTYILKYISAGDWVAIMAMYKDTVNTNVSDFGVTRKLLNQFMKLMTGFSYVFLFVYIYQRARKNLSVKTKALYHIIFVVYMLFRLLLSGGRQGVIFFILAWITMYYICNIMDIDGKLKSINKKKYRKYLFSIVASVFPLFYFFGVFVGRKTEDVIFNAAFSYLSTGIYGLEQEIKNNYASQYWGEYSFPGIYDLLHFFEIIPSNIEQQSFLPFFGHGNTVSMLGRWYWDFGVLGVYIMVIIAALVFCYIFYFGIKYKTQGHIRNIYIILYCYMIHVLYFAGYDDFWINIYSITFICNLFIIVILYKYIVTKKLRIVFGEK
ncbi:MAG: O-antigen polymerase [Anaerovibrio sp.]